METHSKLGITSDEGYSFQALIWAMLDLYISSEFCLRHFKHKNEKDSTFFSWKSIQIIGLFYLRWTLFMAYQEQTLFHDTEYIPVWQLSKSYQNTNMIMN